MARPIEMIHVTDDCYIETQEGEDGRGLIVHVGDDMRMNGMDAPATLRSTEDVRKLITALETIEREWH